MRDGYCTRHHPSYTSPRDRAYEAELERLESDPIYRAEREVAEARREFERALAAVAEAQGQQERASADLISAERHLRNLRYSWLAKRGNETSTNDRNSDGSPDSRAEAQS